MCEIIISIVKLSVTIFLFINIFKILSDTNHDAFQKPFAIGEKETLFYTKETNPLVIPSEIGIKCEMYQNAIMNPKVSKLGEVFNLNIELIHDQIGRLLIVVVLSFVFLVFYIICFLIAIKKKSVTLGCLSCLMILASVSFAVAIFVLLYKLIIIFYKSDMKQFIEFLKCKNVNRAGFANYLYAEKLYDHFIMFVITSIIHIFFNISSSQNINKNAQSSTTDNTQEIELTENL